MTGKVWYLLYLYFWVCIYSFWFKCIVYYNHRLIVIQKKHFNLVLNDDVKAVSLLEITKRGKNYNSRHCEKNITQYRRCQEGVLIIENCSFCITRRLFKFSINSIFHKNRVSRIKRS